jgi:predicted phosphoribosyltransferase
VPVAAPIAARLGVPLDVILVRKIGAPGHSELAIGALAMVGERSSVFRNEEVLAQLGISQATFAKAQSREEHELRRRARALDIRTPNLTAATVILVDDGLATGSTMQAAASAVRRAGPKLIIVAVPVGARQAVRALGRCVDQVICPSTPDPFIAVGIAYQDFHQLTDDETRDLIADQRR